MHRSDDAPSTLAARELADRRPVLHNDLLQVAGLHWSLPAEALQPWLPAPLVPDLYGGEAWFSVLALWSRGMSLGGPGRSRLPLPGVSNHPQLNVRAYVREPATGRTGVFFLENFVPRALAVFFARRLFHLPYQRGDLALEHPALLACGEQASGALTSPAGALRYTLRALHDPAPAASGSLEEFVMERYAALAVQGSRVMEVGILHDPWPLQTCAVEAWTCDLDPAAQGAPRLASLLPLGTLRAACYSSGADTGIYRPLFRPVAPQGATVASTAK